VEWLTTLVGYAVHAWSLQSQVILHWLKEANNLSGRPTDLLQLDSIQLMRLKVMLTKGSRATKVGFSGDGGDSLVD
jgi:hypothetical protein